MSLDTYRAASNKRCKHLRVQEMALDGVPRLNLASFVNTYMEAEVQDLMQVYRLRLTYLAGCTVDSSHKASCTSMQNELTHAVRISKKRCLSFELYHVFSLHQILSTVYLMGVRS